MLIYNGKTNPCTLIFKGNVEVISSSRRARESSGAKPVNVTLSHQLSEKGRTLMPKMNIKPAPIQEQGAGLSVLSTVEWGVLATNLIRQYILWYQIESLQTLALFRPNAY